LNSSSTATNRVICSSFLNSPAFAPEPRKGPRKNHEGSMTEGETVRIKDGMIFDVTETNKS
jgi:hypothetical protein